MLAREFSAAMDGLDAVVTLSALTLPCRIDDPEAVARMTKHYGDPALFTPATGQKPVKITPECRTKDLG